MISNFEGGPPSQARSKELGILNAEPGLPELHPHSGARILLAEDNQVNRLVASRQLQKLGFTAAFATNGLEVLQCLKQVAYDLVIMDCQMPEMDGYEASREIRRRERQEGGGRSPVHIIAMTADAAAGSRERCLAAGMDDYISKPVRLADLQNALERWRLSVSDRTESSKTVSPVESPPSLSVVDLDRLDELTDNDPEQLRDLIALFRTESGAILKNLAQTVKQNSIEEARRLAHKLSGSCSTCGMEALAFQLKRLEQTAATGDASHLAGIFSAVSLAFERVEAELAQLLLNPRTTS